MIGMLGSIRLIHIYIKTMLIAIVVAGPISIESSVFAQIQTDSTSSNVTTNDSQSQIEQLNKMMAELEQG
jgi:ABC-type phosphate transport system permease subunit